MRYIFATHDRSAQISRIKEGIAEYRERGASDPGSFQMHEVYDNLLNQLSDNFLGYWKDRIAVLGLGGYGRKEMSPYSDIDLLFLRPEDAPEGVYRGIRSMLYLMWDARIELGHSVRTVDECRTEADKDLAVLTSLMDTRLVWGNPDIFRKLLIERGRLLHETDPLDLYLRIEAEILKSYEKFSHTIYLLEPHLKEGPGSLRYMQLMAWLTRIIFGCEDLHDLPILGILGPTAVENAKQGMRFLAETRTRLHFLTGRRDDRLKFDAQKIIAEQMGFRNTDGRRAVENFMREYYRHASTIDFTGRRILAKARLFLEPKTSAEVKLLKLDDSFYIGAGGIYHINPENFAEDPREIITAFKWIAITGCEFDIRMVDLIRERLRRMPDDFIEDPEANRLFLDVFKTGGEVARALNSSMKIGFLEIFVPDFSWVRFLPQFDVYHQYTVDLHTMAVLQNIDNYRKDQGDDTDKFLFTIFSKLEKPEALYLAALFHDIAKGRGPGHEVRGEQIAAPVLKRLGLPKEDIEEVCFLIRNHLAMTHIAFRKDLHDEAIVSRFAENIMSKRRLDLLMLLTHADLRAVGPTALNSWRKMLLEELYYRTLDVIMGDEQDGDELDNWVRQIKSFVKEMVPLDLRGPELDAFLSGAPSRYFLDFYPGVIVDHFLDLIKFLKSSGKTALAPGDLIAGKVDNRKPGYSAITIITRDASGLFFRIAGTLTANRINILGAWSHSIDATVVATFHVNDITEGALDDQARWENFKEDLHGVLKGDMDVDDLVATRRKARKFITAASVRRLPVKVEIDNAASDRASIIEVYAHDRPGLLYDISRKLWSMKLDIVLTKITTEIDQAADIFYVQDRSGAKLLDFTMLDEIKHELHRHLTEMETTHFSEKKDGVYTF